MTRSFTPTTQVSVEAIPAFAHRADQLAAQLAAAFADLAGAPEALHEAALGRAGPLPIELAELVHTLDALVTALLSLASRARDADVSYTTVDRDLETAAQGHVQAILRAPVPWPRQPGEWPHLGEAIVRDTGIAGTLAAEAVVGLLPQPVADLAATVGDRVPEGPGWARAASPPAEVTGPATAADLLSEITRAQSTPGQLTLTHIDRTDRWIIALPGIHSMLEAPDPQDLPGAFVAFSSRHGAYSRSVVDALTAAGVPLGSKLLIVGHSQGGIVAADLAADPQVARKWQITDVLTAASPIGGVSIPHQTHLLALDNADDIVPSLDLRADAPQTDRTTIRFRDERGGIGGNHDLAETYTPFARSPCFTNNPQVRRWLAHASPYLSGGPATTQLFDLRDRPPLAPRASGTQSSP